MENKEITDQDWFPNAKIYHNGSHFIAIPHTEKRQKKRPKIKEKEYVISQEENPLSDLPDGIKAVIHPILEIMDDDECLDCPFEEKIEEKKGDGKSRKQRHGTTI